MEVKSDYYHVIYKEETGTIACSGSLELRGKEGFAEIAELLRNVVQNKPPVIILDLRELEFLNTSGITTLGGFIIGIRKAGASRLKVRGAKRYAWQPRAFKGLQKLLPSMETEFE